MAVIVAAANAAISQPSGRDWKLFGTVVSDAGAILVCVFDAKSITGTSDGKVQVLTKCSVNPLGTVSDAHHEARDKFEAMATKKVNDGYVPPLIRAGRAEPGIQIETIVAWELLADSDEFHPLAEDSKELDCREHKSRDLKSELRDGDNNAIGNQPTEWTPIRSAPGETLLKLTCSAH